MDDVNIKIENSYSEHCQDLDNLHDNSGKTSSDGSEQSDTDSDQAYDLCSHSSGDSTDAVGACFDWPFPQQTENAAFNDVSDVLSDGYRINKEINMLLKFVADNDKQDIPPSVGPQPPAYGEGRLPLHPLESNVNKQVASKQSVELQCQDVPCTLENLNYFVNQYYPYNVNPGFVPPQLRPMPPVLNVEEQWSYSTPVMVEQNHPQINLGPLQNPSYEPVKVSCRLEKQQRRREKNRECSRMFRVKQRVKEDSLKRGKLDKEVLLQRLMMESSRLRMVLQELQRNDRLCNISKSIFHIAPLHHAMEP